MPEQIKGRGNELFWFWNENWKVDEQLEDLVYRKIWKLGNMVVVFLVVLVIPQPIKFSFIFFPYGEFLSVGIFFDFEKL